MLTPMSNLALWRDLALWREAVITSLGRDRRVPVSPWCVDLAVDLMLCGHNTRVAENRAQAIRFTADEALWMWYTPNHWDWGYAYGEFTESVCFAWECIIEGNVR